MNVMFLYADGGDWVGMYVDGKLVDEGHSLSEERVLDALGIEHSSRVINFDEHGMSHCPERWDEPDESGQTLADEGMKVAEIGQERVGQWTEATVEDRPEGFPGTWSHCGQSVYHNPHRHTVVTNEGPHNNVVCYGTPGALVPRENIPLGKIVYGGHEHRISDGTHWCVCGEWEPTYGGKVTEWDQFREHIKHG